MLALVPLLALIPALSILPHVFSQSSNATALPLGSCTSDIPCANVRCRRIFIFVSAPESLAGRLLQWQDGLLRLWSFVRLHESAPYFLVLTFHLRFCGSGNCTSNCGALAECGPYAATDNVTCPLNVSSWICAEGRLIMNGSRSVVPNTDFAGQRRTSVAKVSFPSRSAAWISVFGSLCHMRRSRLSSFLLFLSLISQGAFVACRTLTLHSIRMSEQLRTAKGSLVWRGPAIGDPEAYRLL
jgi:hypothetical protein